MSPIKVAIAGFTGRMARLITEALVKRHPDVEIHGIARNASKVDEKLRDLSNVTIFEASAEDLVGLRRAVKGTDICICCYLGDNELMIQGQKSLIDACVDEHVARYLASDWSFDYRRLEYGDHPTKDPMKHVAAYLDERKDRIAAVHVLNGAFMEVMFSPFLGFFDANSHTFKYYGTGDEPYEMSTMEDAAAWTAEIAHDPSVVGYANVLGDRKTAKEVAQIYEKVYGVKTKTESLGELQDLQSKMRSAREQNPTNPYAWIGMHYQYWMEKEEVRLPELHNERYPSVAPTSLEDFLRARPIELTSQAYSGK